MGDPSDSTNPRQDAARLRLKELLSQGELAARNGQRGEARRYFREALALESTNEHAWLWLAYLAPTPRQSLAYLQEARSYHPRSERVRQAMVWAQAQMAQAAGEGEAPQAPQTGREPSTRSTAQRQARPVVQPTPSPRSTPVRAMARPRAAADGELLAGKPQPSEAAARRRRWAPKVVLVLCILALLVTLAVYALRAKAPPQDPIQPPPTSWLAGTPSVDMAGLRDAANDAIAREDWEGVIPLLENMHLLSPDDEGVRQQLAIAHLRCGLRLAEQDRLDEAIAHYDAAIRFYANDMDLQTARRLAIGYRDGRQAARDLRWDEAVTLLEPVFKVAPGFRDVADLLFTANMEQGRAFEAAHQLEKARAAYARAVAIKPQAQEAQSRLAQMVAILTPPTPTPTPAPTKRIEVDISEQRMRAYEDDRVVFDWLCSTGIPTMPTRYGEFQILDKIPEAWSSAWGLRMPYWMGIYWAGASENGIHALPILRNGTTLWSGYLGSKVSFGCVVLDTPNAATLYDWAEIGTPVKITP